MQTPPTPARGREKILLSPLALSSFQYPLRVPDIAGKEDAGEARNLHPCGVDAKGIELFVFSTFLKRT
jgi:hypothetical protein